MTDNADQPGADPGPPDTGGHATQAVDPVTPAKQPAVPDPQEEAIARAAASAVSDNPLGGSGGMAFNLYMPELEVRMINASRFGDYEWWSFAASASLSAMVGFVVAFLQSGETVNQHKTYNDGYLFTALVFLLLLIVFIGRAAVIRRQLTRNSRTYKMKATEVVDPTDGVTS